MIANYVPLDTDSLIESQETDQNKSQTITNLKRLASLQTVALTAVSVALILVLTNGTPVSTPSPTTNLSDAISEQAPPRTQSPPTTLTTPKPQITPCVSDECISAAGALSSSINFDVDPCDNFYKFSCGRWQDDHPYPANVDGWSHFYKLTYEVRKNLRAKLDSPSLKLEPNEPKVFFKLFDFYHGCINQNARNQNGYLMLLSTLADVGGWPSIDDKWDESHYDWEDSIIKSMEIKHFPLIKIQVSKDVVHANRTIIGPNFSFDEGIADDADGANIIKNKKQPLPFFQFYDSTQQLSDKIYKVLAELSPISKSNLVNTTIADDLRDLEQLYTTLRSNAVSSMSTIQYMQEYSKITFPVRQLKARFPGIDLARILEAASKGAITDDTIVFFSNIKFMEALPKILGSTSKRTIANYIGASLMLNLGRYTTTKMVEILVDKLDAPEVLPNICYELTETFLPNLLGRYYVDKYFNKEWKSDMEKIIEMIHNTFRGTLRSDETNWMDAETKAEAIKKVDKINKNVIYPQWTANNTALELYFKEMDINKTEFFSSVLSVLRQKQKQNFMLLHTNEHSNDPENSIEWAIDSWPTHDATYVNAFYYFSTNGIYFPAGIAQAPFYQFQRPMAMNLGSIGMIIGHEMTHSLDNSGSLYDDQGDLRNWWKPETRQSFVSKSQCFVDQYNGFKFPEHNLTVNGNKTLGENIADNGGIRQAYKALKTYQHERWRTNAPPFQSLPGKMANYTEEQLFFISFANMWCSNMMPDAIKRTLLTGEHPPETVRVTGSLANFDEFATAFHCKAGSKMNPTKKCILW